MLNTDEPEAIDLVEVTDADPLLSNRDLPLRAMYFPLGFPLEVVSNSPSVMEAADQSWRRFRSRFPCDPLELRIGVTENRDDADVLPEPVCRMQWNLLSNIADASNFVVSDLSNGRSFGWISRTTAESALYLRYHFLEAAALSMVAALRAAPLHAACVSPCGRGMLLCGDSGAGKSSLAFAGARAGWAFTSDDSTYIPLDRNDRLVVGNCHQIRFRSSGVELFPELEGRPVTPRATGKPSIEVPTCELPQLAIADSSNIKYIVFLNRKDVSNPRLIPVSQESILPWFKHSLMKAGESYSAQEDALRRLLQAEAFELCYRDLDSAVERLETLAVTGR
jgi:hypothetical protein